MNQEDFQLCTGNFQKFVNKVFSGSDQAQKAILLNECQNFVIVGQESKNNSMEPMEVIPYEGTNKAELPNEIWLKIIGFLETKNVFGNVALVCKSFNSLTLQPTAIKRLSFDFKNMDKDYWPKLKALLTDYKTLTDLTIVEACIPNSIDFITKAMISNPCLNSLKILNHSKWICTCFKRINELIQCIKTHRNDLDNLELHSIDYNSEAMKEICTLKNLRSLKISKNSGSMNPKPDFIFDLANDCENLENIAISHIHFSSYSYVNQLRTAWNYFLGQRSKTLKSIDIGVDFKLHHILNSNGLLPASLFNLKLCKSLENVSMRLDDEDLKMLSDIPKLKKLVLKNNHCPKRLLWSLESMDLSSLRYLSISFRNNDSPHLLTKLADLHFPMLERLYLNPESENISNSLDQKALNSLLENTPKLKSIQFGRRFITTDKTNIFLFDISNYSNVLAFFGDSLSQLEMENYFKNRSTEQFEKYQEMKMAFLKWFEKPVYN